MRKVLIIVFFINAALCFSQNKSVITASDSLFYLNSWQLISIDSCGKVINLPAETVYHFTFFDYSNRKTKRSKVDKYYRKQGYQGKLLIYSDEKNTQSKIWCSIKAHYKRDNDKITLFWDDDFKVEENFRQIDSNLSYWFLVGSNAVGNIVEINSNEMVLNMRQTLNKKESICIKFTAKKKLNP